MEYLIGLLVAAIGYGIFQSKKRQSAESLLQNQDVKEKVTDLQAQSNMIHADLKVEESKREEYAKETPKPVIDSELLDFFNSKK